MINFKMMVRGVALVALLGSVACDDFEPVYVDDLTLTPDSVHIAPGETAVFSAIPLARDGTELGDRTDRVRWSLPSGNVAAADTAGGRMTVTGLGLGVATFTARLGRGSKQGRVFVQPPGLARLEIHLDGSPINSLSGPLGLRPRITAHLFDASGNELSPEGFRISWSSANTAVVFIGNSAGTTSDLFLRRTGSTAVRLTVGGMGVSIPVTVF